MFLRVGLLSIFLASSILLHAQRNKVLIIGIDGCRPDALLAANTPNIDSLIANSTYSLDATNEATTLSGPSWSSMLTGVWQDKHGVNDNSFEGKNFSEYPPFFKFLEDFNPDLITASISQWGPINDHITAPFVDYVKNVSNEEQLIVATTDYLTNQNPDALFIQFDDVDHAGHTYGFNPQVPGYIEAIEEVDAGIGTILKALRNRTSYSEENWLIIVAPDHGGIGKSHGGNSIEERNTFIICSGDGIPRKKIRKDSISTNILPPENCLRDSVELYFKGNAKVRTSINKAFNFGEDRDFTVECRVRTSNAADVAIVTDKDWITGRNKGFVFSFKIGSKRWKVNIGDGTNRADVNGNAIDDNRWHTLSATFDRDGFLVIYEDGQTIDSISIKSIGNIYSGFPISFGADALNAYAYKESIAEVRIFNKLLSRENIQTWSCKKIDSTHTDIQSLIGYWRLTDGGKSDSIQDLSPTKANGIISGAKRKSAVDTINTWDYDYSNTPRIVDVATTALAHMCAPVKAEWKLDGKSLIAPCLNTGTDDVFRKTIKVYPNPASKYVIFEGNELIKGKSLLKIYDSLGREVDSKSFYPNKFVYQCNHLHNGLFFYLITTEGTDVNYGKFVVQKRN